MLHIHLQASVEQRTGSNKVSKKMQPCARAMDSREEKESTNRTRNSLVTTSKRGKMIIFVGYQSDEQAVVGAVRSHPAACSGRTHLRQYKPPTSSLCSHLSVTLQWQVRTLRPGVMRCSLVAARKGTLRHCMFFCTDFLLFGHVCSLEGEHSVHFVRVPSRSRHHRHP